MQVTEILPNLFTNPLFTHPESAWAMVVSLSYGKLFDGMVAVGILKYFRIWEDTE